MEANLAKLLIMSQEPKSTKQLLLPKEQFFMFTFPLAKGVFQQP